MIVLIIKRDMRKVHKIIFKKLKGLRGKNPFL